MLSATSSSVAIVAIGRNEGERLKCCLSAALAAASMVVYVDSGSSDGSAAYARSVGCTVHELDAARPFSAARARNEGFARLMEIAPETTFVQFLDGDCELDPAWLEAGIEALRARPELGIARGAVSEMYPERSVYNRLCSLEWQQKLGEVDACGGRFLLRARVFRQMNGMRADLIAGEDDEFCLRVREAGWKIAMLDAPMARHDAAITRWSQWWQRMRRAGHAFAQVAELHPGWPYFRGERRKLWIWGLLVPLAGLLPLVMTHGGSLAAAVGLYALQYIYIARGALRRGWRAADAWPYAAFVVLSRFPGLLGLLEYKLRQRFGRNSRLIEYK
jgi:GT2 family glycosyltransferase